MKMGFGLGNDSGFGNGWGVNIYVDVVNILTDISSITFWVLTNVFLYVIVNITVNRDCIERGTT